MSDTEFTNMQQRNTTEATTNSVCWDLVRTKNRIRMDLAWARAWLDHLGNAVGHSVFGPGRATQRMDSKPVPQQTAARPPARPVIRRPPGEVGGHTVQPGEEDFTPANAQAPVQAGSTSRDTPPPTTAEEGPKDGAGSKEVEAPAAPASEAGPKNNAKPAADAKPAPVAAAKPDALDLEPPHVQSAMRRAHPQGQAAKPAPTAGTATTASAATNATTSAAPTTSAPTAARRPPRPLADAARTTLAENSNASAKTTRSVAADAGSGAGLERDQLVEQVTASLAQMLSRALRQSIEEAVDQALHNAGSAGSAKPGTAPRRDSQDAAES